MANSRIGQYLLEYDLSGFGAPVNSHKLRANIMVQGSPAGGTPPASIDVNLRGGATANLQVVADSVWSYFRLLYPTTVNAASFTLWKWVTNTAKDFIAAGAPALPAGTTGTTTASWQQTLTFRSGGGGIAKLVFIEANQGGNQRSPLIPNAAGTAPQRIAAFALSASSPFQALDNAFLVAALRDSRGENEAIRNRRLGVS
jgi:hypothetical protein